MYYNVEMEEERGGLIRVDADEPRGTSLQSP